MKNNDKILFNAADIERYLSGQMSAEEMHTMERAAMEDPFLADAMEGYGKKAARGEIDTAEDLHQLRTFINKRIEPPNKRIIPVFYTPWWKIAAVVLLIAGSGTLMYYFTTIPGNNKSEIARTITREQKPSPKDSSPAVGSGVIDTTTLSSFNKKAIQPVLIPGKKREPLKKQPSVNPSPEILSPVPSIASKDKSPANMPAKKESANDVASASRSEIPINQLPGEAVASKSKLGYYKTKPLNLFGARVVNQNKEPVANAAVSIQYNKMDTGYVTDSNGYFKFTLPDTMASIVINRPGYEASKVKLRGNIGGSEITLKEINQPLNETAVTRDETLQKRSVQDREAQQENQEAVLVNGMVSFKLYIENNKKIPASSINEHGDVIVSFYVSREGLLDDFKIEKSLSTLLDKEAIRLIKAGPSWKVLKNKRAKATITIHF